MWQASRLELLRNHPMFVLGSEYVGFSSRTVAYTRSPSGMGRWLCYKVLVRQAWGPTFRFWEPGRSRKLIGQQACANEPQASNHKGRSDWGKTHAMYFWHSCIYMCIHTCSNLYTHTHTHHSHNTLEFCDTDRNSHKTSSRRGKARGGGGGDWLPVFQIMVGGPAHHPTPWVWHLPYIYLVTSCLSPNLCESSESWIFFIPVSTTLRIAPTPVAH